jgi:hypothetical protein
VFSVSLDKALLIFIHAVAANSVIPRKKSFKVPHMDGIVICRIGFSC